MSNPGPSRIQNALVNYNNFFNPYLCHVCKTSTNLQICHSCRLISYCSKEHLQLHREQHKEFCLAVLSLSNEIYYSHNMTLKEWTELKKANVKRVKHKLGRNLEQYEEQILLFAKSCLICRRQNDLSVVCKSCTSVSMCYRHISTPYVHTCNYLQLCKTLDILSAVRSERNIQIPLELLNFTHLMDMSTYFEHLGRSSDLDTWSYVNFLHTNYLSRPLTLFFYISSANIKLMFSTILIIHVIAGSFTDRNSRSAWEVFLHHMLPDTSLMIIMTEPKLGESVYKIHRCQSCRLQNKEVRFIYYSMTYRHYKRSRMYLEPHIIIGFNIDFEDDSAAIVEALCENKPLFLTCTSENKAQQVVTEIEKTLCIKPVFNKKNKFASCRPYRDVESDSVIFLHQYLIIYCETACQKSNLNISNNYNQPSISRGLFQE